MSAADLCDASREELARTKWHWAAVVATYVVEGEGKGRNAKNGISSTTPHWPCTTPGSAVAYPSADYAWMHERGLGPTLVNWEYPDPSDDHDPIDPRLWDHVAAHLSKMPPSDYLPAILSVAHADGEYWILTEAATEAERVGAVRTALATACRLHEEAVKQLATAATLLDTLGSDDV